MADQADRPGRRSFATWLTETGTRVPAEIRAPLIISLHGNLPIYVGGVTTTIVVAWLLATRIGTPFFIGWAAFELLMAVIRLPVLLASRRAALAGRTGPQDAYVLLTLLWSFGVGIGAAASVLSEDRVAALVACMTAAAMLGGICFRFFAAPRLVFAMLVGMGGPAIIAGIMTGEPAIIIACALIPLYIYAMTAASWRMYGLLLTALMAEREQSHRARHDALTGLLNRDGLAEAVDGHCGAPIGLFFIDLDGFKQVNDSLGHAAGDRLLAMVADRLRETARPGESVARLGGDEFVLVAEVATADEALYRGDLLVAAITGLPYLMGDDGVLIGASVGVALWPQHGAILNDLLVSADEALYRAKSSDRERCLLAFGPDEEEFDQGPVIRTAA